MEVVPRMPFLNLSNADIHCRERTYLEVSRCSRGSADYPTGRAHRKESAKATLDENVEALVVNVSSLSLGSKMTIHPARESQMALLLTEDYTVPAEYTDFADVCSKESAELSAEWTRIDEHAIELVDGKQPPYGPRHSLGPVGLETLTSYIETNLAIGFIRPAPGFHQQDPRRETGYFRRRLSGRYPDLHRRPRPATWRPFVGC